MAPPILSGWQLSSSAVAAFILLLAFHMNSLLMFGYWQTRSAFISTKVTSYSLSASSVKQWSEHYLYPVKTEKQ